MEIEWEVSYSESGCERRGLLWGWGRERNGGLMYMD